MLVQQGYELVEQVVGESEIVRAREELFHEGEAGTRCLLDVPSVAAIAASVRERLSRSGPLRSSSVAIQAIAFDKTASANWKVTWHQDLMFPFARPVQIDGFLLPSKKDGVDYARPPKAVLEELLAVRIHLDACDELNGPLRVSPGTHREGVIRSTLIAETIARYGETVCLARAGDALLMRPLLLHASSPAVIPKHRRVLHLVYYSGPPSLEPWHRAV